jgi:NADH-quinone oxidoreductase subunit N
MVDITPFGAFFYLLLILISGLTLLFSRQYAHDKGISGDEFYGIVVFAAFSMLLVAGALHWVILFLAVEFLSLSFYILIALCQPCAGCR